MDVMSGDSTLKRVLVIITLSWLVLFTAQTNAIILHPNYEPDDDWTGRPNNDVIGRWATNASCVAVGPNLVITTRHQGGGVGTTVVFGTNSYTVKEVINHSADLRLAMLTSANLTEYADINFANNEVDQQFVVGGYGVGNGDSKRIMGNTLGYYWLYPDSSPNNLVLRWGTNQSVAIAETETGYLTQVLVSQFDPQPSTDYECTYAEHDSGGGWFIQDGNIWKVIGLNRGTYGLIDANGTYSAFKQISFRFGSYDKYPNDPLPNYMPKDSSGNPEILNYLDAVRVSTYADWITDNMNFLELINLSEQWLNTGCDETNGYCNSADTAEYRDGTVNLKDFSVLAAKWLSQQN